MHRREMSLLFIGDVMLGRGVNQVLAAESAAYVWGDTLSYFANASARIGNLECVISDRKKSSCPIEKEFRFRSDSKNVDVLRRAKIDAVSLANNHVLDFGPEALNDMLVLLRQSKIGFAGAGRDLAAAARACVGEVGGGHGDGGGCDPRHKLAMIAVTDNEPDWKAGRKRPGVNFVPIGGAASSRAEQTLDQSIRKLKAVGFLVIVSVHWGGNWGKNPTGEQILFAHRRVDSGADIIFGHSPHVLRAVEFYRDRPILYSTGDFVDDYAVEPLQRNDLSALFFVDVAEAPAPVFRVRLIPTVVRNCQALLARGEERERIVSELATLSQQRGSFTFWNREKGELLIESGHGGTFDWAKQ